MADYQDLLAVKQRAEERQREADRAQGAIEQTLERLKKEFKCSTERDARKLLKKLEREEADAADAYDVAIERHEAEWIRFHG